MWTGVVYSNCELRWLHIRIIGEARLSLKDRAEARKGCGREAWRRFEGASVVAKCEACDIPTQQTTVIKPTWMAENRMPCLERAYTQIMAL